MKGEVSVIQSCLTFVIPWTVGCQAPLSMEFSRQEYWVAIPFSKGSSRFRDQTHIPCIADRDYFTVWALREAHIILKANEKEIVDFEMLWQLFHFLSIFHSGLSLSKHLYFAVDAIFILFSDQYNKKYASNLSVIMDKT